MRIDSHHHFWRFDPVRDVWIDESMQVIRRDFLPEDLQPILQENGIDGTIVVQADQSEQETEFLLDLAEKNSWIRGVVGWVDLCAENIEARLAHFSKRKKLCGFRHIVQAEPDDNFMLGEAFQRGISKLKKYNFSYDILVFPNQLPAAIELVKNHPKQIFILDHIGKPLIKDQKKTEWAFDIKQLAHNKNVYCKLSGIITEAEHETWKVEQIAPYLDTIFQAFGPDRLMFGSDWPVCLLAGSYTHVLALIENYTKSVSVTEKNNIFYNNALKAYGIN